MVTPEELRHRLISRSHAARIPLDPAVADRLDAYYRLLATWNRTINLTAIDLEGLPDSAIDRLFIEPLVASTYAPTGARAIDIGSGGGSPAIPFALGSHASHLTMVESRSRKSVFLKEAARVTGLPARICTERFEQLVGDTAHHRSYEVLTIRAVRLDNEALDLLRVFLAPDGRVFLFSRKGGFIPDGVVALHELCGESELAILR